MEINLEIKNIKKGQEYLGYLFIKSQLTKTASNGSRYFNMLLSDANFDEIDAKKWDVKPDEEALFTNGKLVKIKGRVQEYKKNLQLIVEKMRLIEENEASVDDYVETVPVDIDEMLSSINDIIDQFENKDIQDITAKIFKKHTETLRYFPAAKKSPDKSKSLPKPVPKE